MSLHPPTKTKAKVKKPTSASLKNNNNTTTPRAKPSSGLTVKMTLVKKNPYAHWGHDRQLYDDDSDSVFYDSWSYNGDNSVCGNADDCWGHDGHVDAAAAADHDTDTIDPWCGEDDNASCIGLHNGQVYDGVPFGSWWVEARSLDEADGKADGKLKIDDEEHTDFDSWGWGPIASVKYNKDEGKKHIDSWFPGHITSGNVIKAICKNNRCDLTGWLDCTCEDNYKDIVGNGWGQATGTAAKCSSSADWGTDDWGKADEWASHGSHKVDDDTDADIIADDDDGNSNKGDDKYSDYDWTSDNPNSDFFDGYRNGHRDGHATGFREGYKQAFLEIDDDISRFTEARVKDALKKAAIKRAMGSIAERTTGPSPGVIATRNTAVRNGPCFEFAGIDIESANPDMVATRKIIHEDVDAMVGNFMGTNLDGPSTDTRGGGTSAPAPAHTLMAEHVRFEANGGGHITLGDGPANKNAPVAGRAPPPVETEPMAAGQSTQPGHFGHTSSSHQCPHSLNGLQGPLDPAGRPGTPFPQNRPETQATDDGQHQPGPANEHNHNCSNHYGNCNGYNFCQCQCCVYYDKLISRKIDMAAITAVSYIQQDMVANGASLDATHALMQKAYQMGVKIGQYTV